MSRGSSRKFSRCSVARAVIGTCGATRRSRATPRSTIASARRRAPPGRAPRSSRRATRRRARNAAATSVARNAPAARRSSAGAASCPRARNSCGRVEHLRPQQRLAAGERDHARAERRQRVATTLDLLERQIVARRCASTSRTTRSGCCSGWSERRSPAAARRCGSSTSPSRTSTAVDSADRADPSGLMMRQRRPHPLGNRLLDRKRVTIAAAAPARHRLKRRPPRRRPAPIRCAGRN